MVVCDDPSVQSAKGYAFSSGLSTRYDAQVSTYLSRLTQSSYPVISKPTDVEVAVKQGRLVPIYPRASMGRAVKDTLILCGVTHPFALPEVEALLQALATEYALDCGQPLVVTSLVRSEEAEVIEGGMVDQAHVRGAGIDFRIPENSTCRELIETRLVGYTRGGDIVTHVETDTFVFHTTVLPERMSE
jgi:hypothetical protein